MKAFLFFMVITLASCQGRIAEVAPKKQPLPSCHKKCRKTLETIYITDTPPSKIVQCIYCLDQLKTGFE